MLRKIIVTFFVIICFVLECAVFSHFAFAGIVPKLTIILTSSMGFMRGEKEGLLIGFFCGLLSDVFFGSVLGFYAIIMMYIGYLNGKFAMIFYPEDIRLPIALIVVSDLSYGLLCYILLFLIRGRLDFAYYFTRIIFPEMVYTIVLTVFLYPLILWVNTKLEDRERKRAQKFV